MCQCRFVCYYIESRGFIVDGLVDIHSLIFMVMIIFPIRSNVIGAILVVICVILISGCDSNNNKHLGLFLFYQTDVI